MGRAIRILCTGDLHVGRRPSRVGSLIDSGRASCAAMFREIVELALRERVDAVAISGDLIDKENKYHEAYGPVERGLKKLAQAGIDAFAVSGNHDFDVLPQLLDAVGPERCHLLGRAGAWQRGALIRDGAPVLHLVGWSFPAEHVPDNPLRSFGSLPASPGSDGVPTLGLLHADLDQPDSRYAPVSLRDLQSAPVAMWLLGHIHRPRWIAPNGVPGILYPGSPQAMDPGETGAHGPWLIDIDAVGRITARMIPMSLVRYDTIELDLTGIATREAFDAYIPRQLKQRVADLCQQCGPLELCNLRLRLVGATPLHASLKDHCREVCEQLQLSIERFTVRIEQITIDTRPELDLQMVAAGSSVAAGLARLLLQLQDDSAIESGLDAGIGLLLSRSAGVVEELCSGRAYQPLSFSDYPPPGRPGARAALVRQGMLLLDALLEQKREPRAVGETT